MSMFPKNMLFTSESVTEGHPDKFCDQISDAVLDECLRHDPQARVACECYVTMGLLIVGGEVTTTALFDVGKVVRDVGNAIGYTSPLYGFDVNTAAVLRTFHAQSPDIDLGVTKEEGQIGAGDQGMMFGYACNQTKEFMPLPIQLAHHLAKRLAEVRKSRDLRYLGPDGKTQVTVEYRDGRPVRADYIVIAASHTPDVVTRDGRYTTEEAKQEIIAKVVRPVVSDLIDERTKIVVNGTGKFLVSGPQCEAWGEKNCPSISKTGRGECVEVDFLSSRPCRSCRLLDDVKFDLCDTASNHSQRFGRSVGNVNNPSADERTAVIDANRHGLPTGDVRYAQPGAEWQRGMGGR